MSAAVPVVSSFNNTVTLEGIHLAVSLHTPDNAAVPDLAATLHGLSVGKGHDGIDQSQGTVASATPGPAAPPNMRVHPPFAMYPLMFQSPFAAGIGCLTCWIPSSPLAIKDQ